MAPNSAILILTIVFPERGVRSWNIDNDSQDNCCLNGLPVLIFQDLTPLAKLFVKIRITGMAWEVVKDQIGSKSETT